MRSPTGATHKGATQEGATYLGRLDARPKLLATVGFLVALGLIPQGSSSWPRLLALGGLLAAALVPDGVWLRRTFWLRLVPVLSLAAGMGILIVFTRKGDVICAQWTLGSLELSVTKAGLTAAAELGVRTLLAAAALVALSVRTSGPALLNALAFFRLPRIFLAVLGAVARTLWIVTDEARRMNRARLMRGAGATIGARIRVVGAMIGSLMLRSFDRAERVHRAMLARGYDGGSLRQMPTPPLRPVQLLACLTFAALSFAVPWTPLP
jgi:cobalt/nickel transport system permease protein